MIEVTEEGRRSIELEIREIMRISQKYAPEEFGGEPNTWDNYYDMQNDLLHLSALLVSISPMVGELIGAEKQADYEREIARDEEYNELRGTKNEATNKNYTGDEALRQARVNTKDMYIAHVEAIAGYNKINRISYSAGQLVNKLDEALKRATIDGRRDAN